MKSKEFLYPQSMYIFDYSAINISYKMNRLCIIYVTLVFNDLSDLLMYCGYCLDCIIHSAAWDE